MPTTPFPGMGAMMRMRTAESDMVSSLSRFSILESFTPATGMNS